MSPAPATIDVTRLPGFVGSELVSNWVEVGQDAINGFAEVTGDRQWIHIDAERAKREGPYGTTIAHGFLSLSLISCLLRDAIAFARAPRMAISYGLDRVRFPAPVHAGSRVRGRFTLARVDALDDGAWQATWSVSIERAGSDKPCCVAEWLVRYHP